MLLGVYLILKQNSFLRNAKVMVLDILKKIYHQYLTDTSFEDI